MRTAPIVAQALGLDAGDRPCPPESEGTAFSHAAALHGCLQVFVEGNALPGRWGAGNAGRARVVVLDTAFGWGHAFLATWDAWRRSPGVRLPLHVIGIEPRPLARDDLRRAHAGSPLADLVDRLAHAWPALTHNLHSLDFDGAQVQLQLAFGDPLVWLPELDARVDAFYLHGDGPRQPSVLRQPRVCKALSRLAAPGATAAVHGGAPDAVRRALQTAGFLMETRAGDGAQGALCARHAPAFTPRRAPARDAGALQPSRVLVVGAGLAGCTTAWALARLGVRSTVVDRHPAPAQDTSGNAAGLFHGTVHPQDGAHARFNRTAALHAARTIGQAVRDGGVRGAVQGLLRLETAHDLASMQALLRQQGLPADHVQALGPAQASALCGLPLESPAWFYPEGGWVDPADWARWLLHQARQHAGSDFRGNTEVHSLAPCDGGWALLDAHGRTIDQAPAVVLASAGQTLQLLQQPDWPVHPVRGQTSSVPAGALGTPRPRLPLAGLGYLLPDVQGRAVFGATAQPHERDVAVRDADHAHNLQQLERLLGRPTGLQPEDCSGRAGCRWSTDDRLPLVGAVPDFEAAARASRPLDRPRFVPRRPGLHVHTALGARGIAWSVLGAQVVAGLVCGAPVPLEASLLEAIDPARFWARAVRRAAAAGR